MHCPANGIYILIGETNMILTAMKKSNLRWSSRIQSEDEQASLMKSFIVLKESIDHISNLSDLNPIQYLSPFLDVIRSESTSVVLTCYGLSAVHKFLSYGFINAQSSCAAVATENIADAITHARFMGTDTSSDEVVLVKIIEVLRLLLLSPLGRLLTNESVCELIQSFFRISFEARFSEILRQMAESALVDAVQLLFSCLSQFSDDVRFAPGKKLKLRPVNFGKGSFCQRKRLRNVPDRIFHYHSSDGDTKLPVSSRLNTSDNPQQLQFGIDALSTDQYDDAKFSPTLENQVKLMSENLPRPMTEDQVPAVSEVQSTPTYEDQFISEVQSTPMSADQFIPISEDQLTHTSEDQSTIALADECVSLTPHLSAENVLDVENTSVSKPYSDHPDETISSAVSVITDQAEDEVISSDESAPLDEDYVNRRGVRFTLYQTVRDGGGALIPYGLPCVREVLKLLISLTNPHDQHNTEQIIQIGLNLITIALEAGVDALGKFSSLLVYIQDDMCRNLFSLLTTPHLTLFTSCLRVFFLLFEALRTHLKFQLEMFLTKVIEIVVSESPKTLYEKRQMCLEFLSQFWKIPGLVTELFINYDCDLQCSNLFEDLTKALSKNSFPLAELYSVHLLSLEALLAVVDSIENNCRCRMLSENKPSEKNMSLQELSDEPHSGTKPAIHQGISGYICGQQLLSKEDTSNEQQPSIKRSVKNSSCIRSNRMKISSVLLNHEELMAIKHKKKVLASGIEQFNSRPSKGIAFLQDHELLKSPLDPEELASFLRNNPQLDKKMIGEYISNGKNLKVLEAFVRSFTFENTRIDEALRQYLETFRLPGEAPLISLIMEHFAEHWHKKNNEPFASSDAAFTLAYAVIMLNVDQHNYNARKQNIPMTLEDFKKNLKNVNGGKDFDDDMLEKMYSSIRSEEIVMPAEQTGLVRENYLWKVLLHRGNTEEGRFTHVPNGIFDHDLFSLAWGPTVAALSFIFDKSNNNTTLRRIIIGFHKCATIAAHYKMCEVFDSIIISLCKFTCLVNMTEDSRSLPIIFGTNKKAQMAIKAAFRLANLHRDILREGWKNLLDCVLHLFNAKLLPRDLVEAEDFLNPDGVISLIREDSVIPRAESGLFSSFYSYITSDSPSQRLLTSEDEVAKQTAIECIKECHCEQLITESKFFEIDSLQELVKTLIFLCRCPEPNATLCNVTFDEDSSVFVLELLIKIILLNRDRVLTIWGGIQDHLFCLVMNSAITESTYLLERSVVGILRIAVRLARKEEMIPQVFHSLQGLLYLKSPSLLLVSRQVAYALHELLRTNAANIHSMEHWLIVFSLMERVGAGVRLMQKSAISTNVPKDKLNLSESSGAMSDRECAKQCYSHDSDVTSDTGYVSDCELYENNPQNNPKLSQYIPKQTQGSSENVYSQETSITLNVEELSDNCHVWSSLLSQYNQISSPKILPHDSLAFLKSFKSLAFLVQDTTYITSENFESCVHCVQTFVESSANGGYRSEKKRAKTKGSKERKWSRGSAKWKEEKVKGSRSTKAKENHDDEDDEKQDHLSSTYQQVSIKLLDIMYSLHLRASSIFVPSDANQTLWNACWCPLLQGMSILCCDIRRSVRTSALNLFPRALLVPELQSLSSSEWEACFTRVLFPMLARLLNDINPGDPVGIEETRMRGTTLTCKVFLQHLTLLLELPSFTALWLTILDFMEAYMLADGSGLLAEAIPELIKNMLLVMDTANVFKQSESFPDTKKDRMCHLTWDRINAFLPELQKELLKPPESSSATASLRTCANTEVKNDECQVSMPPMGANNPATNLFQVAPPISVILQSPSSPIIHTGTTTTASNQPVVTPVVALPIVASPDVPRSPENSSVQ